MVLSREITDSYCVFVGKSNSFRGANGGLVPIFSVVCRQIVPRKGKFMAQLLSLDTFASDSGNLTVLEKIMPGPIKRVFYVYETDEMVHVGRRYANAWHAMVCLNGSCRIHTHDGFTENWFLLDDPQKCLLLEPKIWHRIDELTEGAFLVVYSNEYDDPPEYVLTDSSP